MPDPLTDWTRQLRSAALVGTARRPVPTPEPLGWAARPAAPAAEQALDAAALAAALHRAGHLPATITEGPDPAPPDERPAASERAGQLLDLLLEQPPAGAANADALLQHWLRACAEGGRRLPHHRLPALLDRATRVAPLRGPLRAVVDARGHWLAALNPDWAWVGAPSTTTAPPEPAEEWAHLPDPERLGALRRIRSQDPAAARALLESTWAQDPARVRAEHLAVLAERLSADDEDLLERALDDRAVSVRNVATDLLDGLPDSARGRRMDLRLRALVHHKGLLGRSLEVLLPEDPDGPGIRDGLGKQPAGRSARGWWLERIVAGAPLDVWGEDPARVVGKVGSDVRAGLRRAVVRRQDVAWARALLQLGPDPELLGVLPADERERAAAGVLRHLDRHALAAFLARLPAPWSPALSEAVVADLSRRPAVGYLDDLALGERLHPAVLPLLQRWLPRIPDKTPTDKALARSVRHLVQLHTLRHAISEAFR